MAHGMHVLNTKLTTAQNKFRCPTRDTPHENRVDKRKPGIHVTIPPNYPVTCRVVLSREQRFYAPGDCVKGRVIFSPQWERGAGAPKECVCDLVAGIKVALQGTAFSKFKERGQVFTKTHVFLDQHIYVLGGPGQGLIRIPPGINSYDFSFQLPPSSELNLPTSFKSAFGIIVYQINVCLQEFPSLPDCHVKKGEKTIQVRGGLEIGREYESPLHAEKVKRPTFGGLCTKYSFDTPRSGFMTGQSIQFELRADGNEETLKGTVALVLKTTYHGGIISRAWKDTYTVIKKVVNENVEMSKPWNGELPVPNNLCPSYAYGGGSIEFRYLLQASLEVGSGTIVFKFEKPVKIGTSLEPLPLPLAETTRVRAPAPAPAAPSIMTGLGLGSLHLTGVIVGCRRESHSNLSLPSYSRLCLNRDLSQSLETLPPSYEEAEAMVERQHLDKSEADQERNRNCGLGSAGRMFSYEV